MEEVMKVPLLIRNPPQNDDFSEKISCIAVALISDMLVVGEMWSIHGKSAPYSPPDYDKLAHGDEVCRRS